MKYYELNHLKCRREDRRRQIVSEYNMEVIIFTRLLNGETRTSDTGDTLTDVYYEFLCTKKDNEKEKYIIICGRPTGKNFIELAGLENPRFFDPYVGILNNERNNNEGNKGNRNVQKRWNPLAIELYNAINLLAISWGKTLYGRLLKIKQDVEKYYYQEPFESKIEYVNSCIGYDSKKRKLSDMIEELREQGNNIREFEFPLIEGILGDRSNF